MSDRDDVPPEAVFTALSNDLRLRILHVLADATETERRWRSFTGIYDRLDVDSTSRLSYHLDALQGAFVRRSDRGYALTQAGDRVVRAIRAGVYADQPSFESTTLEGRCPHCDATELTAAYRDPVLGIDCDACGERMVTYDLPPAEPDARSAMETLYSCNRRAHHEYATALGGTCSRCGGTTAVELEPGEREATFTCVATCRQCRLQLYAPLEVRLLSHPAVVSFYWDHGVDATTLPLWELPAYVDGWDTRIVERAPLQLAVTVAYEGDTMQLTVDETLTVSERATATSPPRE